MKDNDIFMLRHTNDRSFPGTVFLVKLYNLIPLFLNKYGYILQFEQGSQSEQNEKKLKFCIVIDKKLQLIDSRCNFVAQ